MEFEVAEDDELRRDELDLQLNPFGFLTLLEAGGPVPPQELTYPWIYMDDVRRDRPLEVPIAGVAVSTGDLRGNLGQAGEQRCHGLMAERRRAIIGPVAQLLEAEVLPELRRVKRRLVE